MKILKNQGSSPHMGYRCLVPLTISLVIIKDHAEIRAKPLSHNQNEGRGRLRKYLEEPQPEHLLGASHAPRGRGRSLGGGKGPGRSIKRGRWRNGSNVSAHNPNLLVSYPNELNRYPSNS